MQKPSQKNTQSCYEIPTETRTPHGPLVSVQSEGESLGKRLRQRQQAKFAPTPTAQVPGSSFKSAKSGKHDSSDESGNEDEFIVPIDSPSKIGMD